MPPMSDLTRRQRRKISPNPIIDKGYKGASTIRTFHTRSRSGRLNFCRSGHCAELHAKVRDAVKCHNDKGKAEQETIWLTQCQMAELFDTSPDNIGLHLKNIFGEGELDESATTEDSSVVQMEGKRQVTRTIKHYNLAAIISVSYLVNARRVEAASQ